MRFVFVSGGSGGHLSPLVAVAHALKTMQPDATVMMACSDRPDDAAYLMKEKFPPSLILPRPRKNLVLPFTLMKDVRIAKEFLQKEKIAVVFAKGAAVSVPLCYAAKKLKIPIVIHESDAVMGRANRIIARWAEVICLGFAATNLKHETFKPETIVTGNPLRPHITNGNKETGLRITGLSGSKPILLVIGGSQGAEALNNAVTRHIEKLLTVCDIIHLTGKEKTHAQKRDGYWSAEFVYDELRHLYAAASFALSRAGAGTISELAANGVPAIYVPIRGLAHDHQMANATRAQENGVGIILLQSVLDEKLFDVVHEFSGDAAKLQKISTSARAFQMNDASRHIAEIIVQCVARSRNQH